MQVNSYYPVLCVDNLDEVSAFYQTHFGFEPAFENDWYTHLTLQGNEAVNIALVRRDHESVPEAFQRKVDGMLLNFEIEDVDALYQTFKEKGLNFLLDIRDEDWGQRHFIVTDPAGVMVDVIKLIEPSEAFKQHYVS